jgi:hypothetical protein
MYMTSAIAKYTPQAPENQKFTSPQEQLNKLYLPVARAISDASCLIPELANLVAQYELDGSATNWYTAISLLKMPIQLVPSLPANLREILESECPVFGSAHKVKDTHFLSLIHKDYNTIDDLAETYLEPFGQKSDLQDKHPFKLRLVKAPAQEYRKSPFKETYFLLATKDVVPKSRSLTWDEQVKLLEKQKQKTGVNYHILTLEEGFAAATTHKVATDESLYTSENQDTKNNSNWMWATYIRVPEMVGGHHLALGGYNSSGISITTAGNAQAKQSRVGIAIGVRL